MSEAAVVLVEAACIFKMLRSPKLVMNVGKSPSFVASLRISLVANLTSFVAPIFLAFLAYFVYLMIHVVIDAFAIQR
jgi:hypothetical protein